MLDHVGFAVKDAEASRAFYAAALAPLGLTQMAKVTPEAHGTKGVVYGFGDTHPFFWVGDNERVGEGTHVAFTAGTRDQVNAFHKAAIAAGGVNNGEPGLRPQYHPNYYAAFVFDPDGMNIEAVCHKPA